MLIGHVYSIFNRKKKKRFIGRSLDTDRRIKQHFKIRDLHPLHFDMQQQPREDFEVTIHSTVIGDDKKAVIKKLRSLQETLIVRYGTRDFKTGYNVWCEEMKQGTDPSVLFNSKGQTPTGRAKRIGQYDQDGNLIKVYDSMLEASRQTGISVTAIWNVCNGKTDKTKVKRNRRYCYFIFKKLDDKDSGLL